MCIQQQETKKIQLPSWYFSCSKQEKQGTQDYLHEVLKHTGIMVPKHVILNKY